MRLAYHPKAHSDVDGILDYYENVVGQHMADDFYAELRRSIAVALERPTSFSIRYADLELRRVNLLRFPYHFLFKVDGDTVKIVVVRHHRQHPDWGIRRR